MLLEFTKVHEDAIFPQYQTAGASGMDLHSIEEITLAPGEYKLIRTGLTWEGPVGTEAQIRPRSGLALKHGVTVLNSPGTIDYDYTGEIKVILINHGKEDFTISKGDRIAQIVICNGLVHVGQYLKEDREERNSEGFGTTGV